MIFIVFYHINVFYIVIFHHHILFSKRILRNNSEIPKLILRQKKGIQFATEILKVTKVLSCNVGRTSMRRYTNSQIFSDGCNGLIPWYFVTDIYYVGILRWKTGFHLSILLEV